jgi:alpha-tubulin suppressor-like RCC1 family protein
MSKKHGTFSPSRRSSLKSVGSWLLVQAASMLPTNKAAAFLGFRSQKTRSKSAWHFWGSNSFGQFGNGVNGGTYSSPVSAFSANAWQKIVVGGDSAGTTGYYSAGLKNTAALWSFGRNNSGQLGIGDLTDRSSPVQIGSVTAWSDVYGGFSRCNFALRTDGSLYAWGQNPEGNLGNGNILTCSTPILIAGTWTTIAIGDLHVLGIKSDGSLWGWGTSASGQTGGGVVGVSVSTPVQVLSGSTFVKIAAGHSNSYAIKSDGTLWAWGTNSDGQIGIGLINALKYSTPVQVGSLTTWTDVKAAGATVFAKKADGTFWCWGYNSEGELGLGDTTGKSTPVQLPGTNWSTILPSWGFSIGLKTDGTLYSWGMGTGGVLGTGSTANASTPVQISGTWQKVFVGQAHVVALKS